MRKRNDYERDNRSPRNFSGREDRNRGRQEGDEARTDRRGRGEGQERRRLDSGPSDRKEGGRGRTSGRPTGASDKSRLNYGSRGETGAFRKFRHDREKERTPAERHGFRNADRDVSFRQDRDAGREERPERSRRNDHADAKKTYGGEGRRESGFEGKFKKHRDREDDRPRAGRQQEESRRNAPFKKTGRGTARPDYEKEQAMSGRKTEEAGTIRLNRYIANAGICSRREADVLISSGQITVNGKTVSEMGYKVNPTDVVKYGKRLLNPEKLVYLLLNKPKDYITTMEDPEERKTVLELIEGACTERIYPVGRLDRNTTGLLLMTNDGELADKLTHPSGNIKKVYQAELDKPITLEHFEALREGITLDDGFAKPDQLSVITPDAFVVGIEIHSGRNRIVRRMFEHFGYEVKKLDRTTFAGLTKKDLPRGSWRFLTPKEVVTLKYLL